MQVLHVTSRRASGRGAPTAPRRRCGGAPLRRKGYSYGEIEKLLIG